VTDRKRTVRRIRFDVGCCRGFWRLALGLRGARTGGTESRADVRGALFVDGLALTRWPSSNAGGDDYVGRETAPAFTELSAGHRVPSSEDASSANTTLCPVSMSESERSIDHAGARCDRKIKPVALGQNQTIADTASTFLLWAPAKPRQQSSRSRKVTKVHKATK
jgi:hypothetical protein